MNVAKYLLLAVLALPFLELVAFIAIAQAIGFCGPGADRRRPRWPAPWCCAMPGVTISPASASPWAMAAFPRCRPTAPAPLTLFAGILLLIPGFITDVLGLLLLIAPLRRALAALIRPKAARPRNDGVVDLEPEQWHQVPDPALPERRDERDSTSGRSRKAPKVGPIGREWFVRVLVPPKTLC